MFIFILFTYVLIFVFIIFVEDTVVRIVCLKEDITTVHPVKAEVDRLRAIEAEVSCLRRSISELHATIAMRDSQIIILERENMRMEEQLIMPYTNNSWVFMSNKWR